LARVAVSKTRTTISRPTSGTPFFQRDGQTYGPTGQPVCHVCFRPEGDPRLCYHCGNGLDRIYPTLRRERIETLKKQLAALEAAALEDMWRMSR
jgi:hypothetical protein